jgi:hypothetical protein
MLFHILLHARSTFGRFEHWFDQHFGWFFTNGMKVRVPDEVPPRTAEQGFRA